MHDPDVAWKSDRYEVQTTGCKRECVAKPLAEWRRREWDQVMKRSAEETPHGVAVLLHTLWTAEGAFSGAELELPSQRLAVYCSRIATWFDSLCHCAKAILRSREHPSYWRSGPTRGEEAAKLISRWRSRFLPFPQTVTLIEIVESSEPQHSRSVLSACRALNRFIFILLESQRVVRSRYF